MKPEKIIDGQKYEISNGKSPTGGVKKMVVTVIEKNLITKTWLCKTEDGKEIKVKDPARFLKEVKPKEKAESPQGKPGKGPKKSKDKTSFEGDAPKAEVSDEVKKTLKAAVVIAQKKARIAAQAFDAGIGGITQYDVDEAEREAKAAKEKAMIAGVFTGSTGRSNGQMGGKAAALKVLREEGRPMRAKELCELAHQRGYCELTGATPEATVAAAIATDIKVKGANSAFKRVEAGLFAANDHFNGTED